MSTDNPISLPTAANGGPTQGAVPASKPRAKSWKRLMRIERAVRLEATGQFKDSEIAAFIGLSTGGLSVLKRTQDYKLCKIKIASKVIDKANQELYDNLEYPTAVFRQELLPMALQGLKESLMSNNERIRLSAAQDVLDREGHFSKVSRINIKPDMPKTNEKDDNAATSLLAALETVEPTPETIKEVKPVTDKVQ